MAKGNPIPPPSRKYGSSGAAPLGGTQRGAVSTMKGSEKARGSMQAAVAKNLKNRAKAK